MRVLFCRCGNQRKKYYWNWWCPPPHHRYVLFVYKSQRTNLPFYGQYPVQKFVQIVMQLEAFRLWGQSDDIGLNTAQVWWQNSVLQWESPLAKVLDNLRLLALFFLKPCHLCKSAGCLATLDNPACCRIPNSVLFRTTKEGYRLFVICHDLICWHSCFQVVFWLPILSIRRGSFSALTTSITFCLFVLQFVFDRIMGAFTHKLWRVRESVLICLQKTLNQ